MEIVLNQIETLIYIICRVNHKIKYLIVEKIENNCLLAGKITKYIA